MNLEKRISELETQMGGEDKDLVWTIFLVALRATGDEAAKVVGYEGEGQSWVRKPGETVEELRARVDAEIHRQGVSRKVAMVSEQYA